MYTQQYAFITTEQHKLFAFRTHTAMATFNGKATCSVLWWCTINVSSIAAPVSPARPLLYCSYIYEHQIGRVESSNQTIPTAATATDNDDDDRSNANGQQMKNVLRVRAYRVPPSVAIFISNE